MTRGKPDNAGQASLASQAGRPILLNPFIWSRWRAESDILGRKGPIYAQPRARFHTRRRHVTPGAVFLVLPGYANLPARRGWQLGLHCARSAESSRVYRAAEPR